MIPCGQAAHGSNAVVFLILPYYPASCLAEQEEPVSMAQGSGGLLDTQLVQLVCSSSGTGGLQGYVSEASAPSPTAFSSMV